VAATLPRGLPRRNVTTISRYPRASSSRVSTSRCSNHFCSNPTSSSSFATSRPARWVGRACCLRA